MSTTMMRDLRDKNNGSPSHAAHALIMLCFDVIYYDNINEGRLYEVALCWTNFLVFCCVVQLLSISCSLRR